jgi:hypothetical protein
MYNHQQKKTMMVRATDVPTNNFQFVAASRWKRFAVHID